MDMDRRAADKWHLDRTINLPLVWMIAASVVTVITLFNGLVNDLGRERDRVTSVEASQAQQRIEQGQIRAELIQQQGQVRVEMSQQLNKIESEIKQEIRELRNDVKRATNGPLNR